MLVWYVEPERDRNRKVPYLTGVTPISIRYKSCFKQGVVPFMDQDMVNRSYGDQHSVPSYQGTAVTSYEESLNIF